jgi:hypothetical protein
MVAAASVLTVAAGARTPTLHVSVFANTGIRLTDIVWTGHRFLYVENTTNRVLAAGPSGMPLVPFAQMPRQVEETRCVTSLGGHGFPAGTLYCRSPDNKVYRLSPDGKTVKLFAVLPHSPRSDGALTFDTTGAFGYRLVAATGRSGATTSRGGAVFTIAPRGVVRRVGTYSNAGGADEIAVAPSGFGSASGDALLTVDAGHKGSVVAMDAQGNARTLVRLSDGPNPIVVVKAGQAPPAGAAKPGLYVTDTTSHDLFFMPAAELKPFSGAVIVGSELHARFWVVRPRGSGFVAQRLPTDLTGSTYNLEAAIYIAP